MTVPKAISMLQDFIDFKIQAAEVMRKGAAKGNVGDLARQAANLHDKERKKLEQILKELESDTKKTLKPRTKPNIKDMIAKQVRIELAKELKKVKHDTKRKKKSF